MPSIEKSKQKTPKTIIFAKALMVLGGLLGLFGLIMLYFTFGPAVGEEVKYRFTPAAKKTAEPPKPIDTAFSLLVPRIRANVKVIPNVNPYNEAEYQRQLANGVAHARGTVFPGQPGNTFLFAHSSRNWEIANQYNAVFYLLYKLKKGDDIYVAYNKEIFHYQVREAKYVDPKNVQYLSPDAKTKTLTLMTCWPPGTTSQRLLVIAEMVQ